MSDPIIKFNDELEYIESDQFIEDIKKKIEES